MDNGETARETLSERINVESKRRREVCDFPSLRTVSRRDLCSLAWPIQKTCICIVSHSRMHFLMFYLPILYRVSEKLAPRNELA